MGLFDFIKGQFIEVIEWLDDKGALVYRFPAYDNAIKMGAKLVVRESQNAIFVNEGRIADVFGPGTHTLSTQNLPVLTALNSWKYAFNSPFKSDVYFLNTTTFTDLKWGTTNPVIMRDPEFGIIRMRGYGNYSVKINDPVIFLKEIFGTKQEFTTSGITGFLKSIVVSGISDLIGEAKIPVADLSSSYDELGQLSISRLQPRFSAIGLLLVGVTIENISLPEDVEKMIDRKSSMNIAGNLDQYMKFQTAEAIRDAANNDGGIAGAGAGLGAGMAMGQMMNQMLGRPAEQQQTPAPQSQSQQSPTSNAPSTGKKFCSECGGKLAENAKFCSDCGSKTS
ncbi:SPFH domain-containing protein [Cohnella lupini]|uniref:Membrane protease subunit (Stomatin/prohibitin family) n=1 Tax=Cohnella lupini TaxID=1294267 RepID=A0A3D9I731_9BACL|nr:SPFH domain-containing protein [Cohnella lupini]RED57552.1 membrane protease subunit (stomatin/prohibitin family) [Cohnella lupini]